jgi:fatty acid desaturase
MAEELQVGTTRVKLRNPFGVFVLSIVTFGIYYFVWYYKVNRELRDAARIDVSPVAALLAVSVGWLIIVPPFVSWYRTFQRLQQAQRQAGLAGEVNPILGFILFLVAVVFLPVETLYAQDELNKLWRTRSASA